MRKGLTLRRGCYHLETLRKIQIKTGNRKFYPGKGMQTNWLSISSTSPLGHSHFPASVGSNPFGQPFSESGLNTTYTVIP